ncbi:MAG: phosphoadenylyl-sulfate reductase [Acidobacteria bacterium]|nr:phosphoadenylyl-sulfate reductase [Acidobacteriota bacterium]
MTTLVRDDARWLTEDVISWGLGREGTLAISISTQRGGLVLLHQILQIKVDIAVLFLDTGYHFQETLEFRDELAARWSLNLITLRPRVSRQELETVRGMVYETNPDACCNERKVEVLREALADYSVWFTALRRGQSASRHDTPKVERYEQSDTHTLYKVNPLVEWTFDDIATYTREHDIPEHPLYAEGYSSVGCAPCTVPTFGAGDSRDGRWNGRKVECGLHIRVTAE